MLFLQASCRAVITGVGAGIARVDTVLKLLMHDSSPYSVAKHEMRRTTVRDDADHEAVGAWRTAL
jgi:hypothetical protein